jgi:hypothetical protein
LLCTGRLKSRVTAGAFASWRVYTTHRVWVIKASQQALACWKVNAARAAFLGWADSADYLSRKREAGRKAAAFWFNKNVAVPFAIWTQYARKKAVKQEKILQFLQV